MSAPSTSSLSVITVTCYRRKIWLLYLFLAIYKASAVWISLRSMLGRARGVRVFDISSFVQTVRWEKINSADGTMNKRTKDSHFLIVGVPYHLILHGKFQGSEIRAWKFGWRGGGGGNFRSLHFLWFRRESENSVMIKMHGKKLKLLIQCHTYNMYVRDGIFFLNANQK